MKVKRRNVFDQSNFSNVDQVMRELVKEYKSNDI